MTLQICVQIFVVWGTIPETGKKHLMIERRNYNN